MNESAVIAELSDILGTLESELRDAALSTLADLRDAGAVGSLTAHQKAEIASAVIRVAMREFITQADPALPAEVRWLHVDRHADATELEAVQ